MKILQNFEKFSNLFGDLKSMTNYLPFETNRRVLAQLVKKCHALMQSKTATSKYSKNKKN